MAEETITLPKSGLVLKYDQPCGEYTLRLCDDVSLNIAHVYAQNHWGWYAWVSTNDDSGEKGSRDECLAWLDARVIELRAALLPPGAIVVEDSPETVERVAQALMTQDAWNPKTLSELDDSNRSCHQAAAMRFRAEARAALAALRESRP